jgi:acyl-coenzyme A synthetase/AMP-(fatty) acid ligase
MSQFRWRGTVLVAVNSRFAGQEVRYICEHSGAKLLVVDSECGRGCPRAAPSRR